MFTRLPVVFAFALLLASVCPPAAQAQGTGANWELLKMCMEAGHRPPETNVTPPYLPDGKLPPPLVSAPCGNAQAAPLAIEGAPSPTDPRVVAWVDPNVKWSTYPKGYYRFQSAGQEELELNSLPEPGYKDPNTNDYLVMRAADPDGSGCAIRHRALKGQKYRINAGVDGTGTGLGGGATARASILCRWGRNAPACHKPLSAYWAVWAVWVDSDHPSNGTDMVINTYGHSVTSKNWQSLLPMQIKQSGTFVFSVNSNPVLDEQAKNGIRALHEKIDVVAQVPATKGVWHYFVRQYKFGYLPSHNPHYRVWHAVNDGPARQIVDTNLPNATNESAGFHPWKFGNYMWCVTDNCWGSSNSRTLYTKGIYIFRDVPGATPLNPDTLLKLARSR